MGETDKLRKVYRLALNYVNSIDTMLNDWWTEKTDHIYYPGRLATKSKKLPRVSCSSVALTFRTFDPVERTGNSFSEERVSLTE